MNKTVQQLMVDKINANVNEEIVKFIREDLAELHLRREIERMADKVKVGLSYIKGGYTLHYTGWNNIALFPTSVGMMGPYTLQQCHDKLREISGE